MHSIYENTPESWMMKNENSWNLFFFLWLITQIFEWWNHQNWITKYEWWVQTKCFLWVPPILDDEWWKQDHITQNCKHPNNLLMGEEREWESGMCEFKLCVDPQILGFVTKLPYSTNGLNWKCKERQRPYGLWINYYLVYVQTFLYLYVREKFKSLLNIPIVTKH